MITRYYIIFGLLIFFGTISYIMVLENFKLRKYCSFISSLYDKENVITNNNVYKNTNVTSNISVLIKELLHYITTIEEISYLIYKNVEVVPNILLNQNKEIQEKEKSKEVLKYWCNSFISQAAISFRTTTDEYFKIKKFLSKETDSCYNTILSNVGNFLNTKIKELENNEREDSNIE